MDMAPETGGLTCPSDRSRRISGADRQGAALPGAALGKLATGQGFYGPRLARRSVIIHHKGKTDTMNSSFAFAAIALTVVAGHLVLAVPASAQSVQDEYCTRISQNDKFASDGYQLSDAASILRQDRANFHKFGMADDEDQGDNTFSSTQARARIPALVDNGDSDQGILNSIVNRTPFVCVEIYRNYMYVYGG
ncbi:hypothetical protein [Hoeflea sp.]|uniref:hypothetical protein n=1 Tax=Hoeflea sp. TaxID=1940281 RepID=UPI0019B5A60F|nr:hypothetical protein [Hoeflea sp.]MBC7282292.1 hypothetical protein [Hoeflea sp.]